MELGLTTSAKPRRLQCVAARLCGKRRSACSAEVKGMNSALMLYKCNPVVGSHEDGMGLCSALSACSWSAKWAQAVLLAADWKSSSSYHLPRTMTSVLCAKACEDASQALSGRAHIIAAGHDMLRQASPLVVHAARQPRHWRSATAGLMLRSLSADEAGSGLQTSLRRGIVMPVVLRLRGMRIRGRWPLASQSVVRDAILQATLSLSCLEVRESMSLLGTSSAPEAKTMKSHLWCLAFDLG
mmetsp:Transcript_47262/g.150490  ORF Transcript_47262/g.150490 Transcript_47262/m.150490 type:complete len:241 (-) Transcript_47262:82-804(-)